MSAPPTAGDRVQTPLGKGVVREVRNGGRLLVEVQGRALVFDTRSVRRLDNEGPDSPRRHATTGTMQGQGDAPPGETRIAGTPAGTARIREVDLHGLTVEQAIARVDDVLEACMRNDVAQLRVIHGRSGGRIRAALHRRLAGIPSVRAFGIDTSNPGVTNVFL